MKNNITGFQSIDDYIKTFPKDVQQILQELRSVIRAAAPDAGEKTSYGIPAFTLNGNLVHFAAFKKHVGFYPTPSGIQAFKKELSVYNCSKGAVQFLIGNPLPLALIAKIVKFRVVENIKILKTNRKKEKVKILNR